MFKTHQTAISNACLADPSGKILGRIMTMTILSIQQPFYQMQSMMDDVDANGVDSRFLWGMKRNAYKYILKNRADIMQKIYAYLDGKMDLPDLLLYVASCPSLGLVKAGFVIQLAIGEIGCLDVHNLRRFGLSATAFKFGNNASYQLMRGKAELYIKTCQDVGGCEYLWDSWCDYVAERNPKKYADGFEVSEIHAKAIGV